MSVYALKPGWWQGDTNADNLRTMISFWHSTGRAGEYVGLQTVKSWSTILCKAAPIPTRQVCAMFGTGSYLPVKAWANVEAMNADGWYIYNFAKYVHATPSGYYCNGSIQDTVTGASKYMDATLPTGTKELWIVGYPTTGDRLLGVQLADSDGNLLADQTPLLYSELNVSTTGGQFGSASPLFPNALVGDQYVKIATWGGSGTAAGTRIRVYRSAGNALFSGYIAITSRTTPSNPADGVMLPDTAFNVTSSEGATCDLRLIDDEATPNNQAVSLTHMVTGFVAQMTNEVSQYMKDEGAYFDADTDGVFAKDEQVQVTANSFTVRYYGDMTWSGTDVADAIWDLVITDQGVDVIHKFTAVAGAVTEGLSLRRTSYGGGTHQWHLDPSRFSHVRQRPGSVWYPFSATAAGSNIYNVAGVGHLVLGGAYQASTEYSNRMSIAALNSGRVVAPQGLAAAQTKSVGTNPIYLGGQIMSVSGGDVALAEGDWIEMRHTRRFYNLVAIGQSSWGPRP